MSRTAWAFFSARFWPYARMMIWADGLCARIHAGRQIEPMKVLKWRGGMLMTSRFVSPLATRVRCLARSLRYLSLPRLLPLFRLANAFIAKARNSVFISFAVVLSIVITPLRNCWLLQYCCGAWLGDVRTLERSLDPRPLALARRYHPRMRGHKTTLA